MTTISSNISGIPVSQLQKLDTSKLAVKRASPDMIARMEEAWKMQFRIPVGKADNDPSNIYATVKAGGKVVATIYNSGGTETSNATYAQVKDLPSMGEGETLTGPALAQKRAEDIAQKLGGTVSKASTAVTAAQWAARPPMQWTYDYKAMKEALSDATARTKTDTQIIAQNPLLENKNAA